MATFVFHKLYVMLEAVKIFFPLGVIKDSVDGKGTHNSMKKKNRGYRRPKFSDKKEGKNSGIAQVGKVS